MMQADSFKYGKKILELLTEYCIIDVYFCGVFLFVFILHCGACRILVPQPGIEARLLVVEVHSPNQWTTREFPVGFLYV